LVFLFWLLISAPSLRGGLLENGSPMLPFDNRMNDNRDKLLYSSDLMN
jgi:hypothetical protein